MKRIIFLPFIMLVGTIVITSCKKHETQDQPPTEAQMLTYMDSMLRSVGVASYNDVLTGKLEGNFEFFAYTAPYESNCTVFNLDSQLNGSVATDSTHTTPVNAGNLYVNDLVIKPNTTNNLRYVINVGDADYVYKQTELNKLYGKTNSIKLVKDGVNIFNKTLYIPKYIVMTGYNCENLSMKNDPIGPGSVITWNADYNNKNGVVIQIEGHDAGGEDRYTYLLAPDAGKYTIKSSDISLYPKEKNQFLGLSINLIRGNFFFTKGTDGRKYNFTLTTNCAYYFSIK